MTDSRNVEPRAGEVSVVTGASRGIGRLLALHLAQAGTRVVAIARPSSELDSLSAVAPGRLIPIAADVTDAAAVEAAFARASQEFGRPTSVITCAGSIDALGPVATVDPDTWWRAVAVDLRGTMLTAQAALRAMLPSGQGRIVTVYGNLGDRGTPSVSAFAVAKAGVARLTETLANEVRDTGVTVIGMHPGFVRTPMTEHLAWSEDGQRWLPTFGANAERNWGDGVPATRLLDQILDGEADALSGRVVHVGESLEEAAQHAAGNANFRRLRLQLWD